MNTKHQIEYLLEEGLNKSKVLRLSDDEVCMLYDITKRMNKK